MCTFERCYASVVFGIVLILNHVLLYVCEYWAERNKLKEILRCCMEDRATPAWTIWIDQSQALNETHVQRYERRSTFPMKMHCCHITIVITKSIYARYEHISWVLRMKKTIFIWNVRSVIFLYSATVHMIWWIDAAILMTIHCYRVHSDAICTNEWKKSKFSVCSKNTIEMKCACVFKCTILLHAAHQTA